MRILMRWWRTPTPPLVRADMADEYLARPMTEAIARVLQGVELLHHSTTEVSDAFWATRNGAAGSGWGVHYGTWQNAGSQPVAQRIVARAAVQ